MIATAEHPSAKTIAAPPLRVLLALPGLHRVVRGAEVAFEEIARALARLDGFDVTLIGSGPPRDDEPYHYRRARCIRRERFEKWPSIPYLRGHYAYEEFTFAPGLFTAYSPSEFNVTLTCGYPYSNWVLRSRRQGLFGRRPKHIFVTQNGDWMVHANNWEFKHFGCDGLVCINPEYFQRNHDHYPCALIPNGVDPELFYPAPQISGPDLESRDSSIQNQEDHSTARSALNLPRNVPLVLMVSALIPSKRIIEGIRCVAATSDFHLAIAGDGELRQQVNALAAELLPGRFHRLTLPRQQMPQLYRAADVCLHMSVDEPFGNVYVEAMASGLPIVGHDWAVTRWIVEDCGILVDSTDFATVADALRRAMSQRDAPAVAARRKRTVEQFSWDAVGKQYAQFLGSVCGR